MSLILNGSNTPTAGGIGYGDGSALVFNSVGTSGQVLTSAGASAPTWSTPSPSAMSLISTKTASASAYLEWTGLSGYNNYLLIINNLYTTATANPTLLIGTGATPTYITSGYNSSFVYYQTPAVGGTTRLNDTSWYIGRYTTLVDTQGWSGFAFIQNFLGSATGGSGTNTLGVSGKIAYNSATGSLFTTQSFDGFVTIGSGPQTAIKFAPDSGNFTGKASLYGISS